MAFKLIEETSREIESKFCLNEKESNELANQLLIAIDYHGGNSDNWLEILSCIDVIIPAWLKLKK